VLIHIARPAVSYGDNNSNNGLAILISKLKGEKMIKLNKHDKELFDQLDESEKEYIDEISEPISQAEYESDCAAYGQYNLIAENIMEAIDRMNN